jgi:glycosyltransferase involved in cell wall biosynthesis
MKVLQLCNKPPFPPQDGGSIAMNNISHGLLEAACDLKIVSVNTKKHHVDIKDLPTEYVKNTHIEFINIDTRVRAFPALMNLLFSTRSYNIIRFEQSRFENRLIEILKKEDFDIVLIESVFLNYYADIIRKYSKSKIVLRAHNVEFLIWERLAKEKKCFLKRKYLSVLSKRLKKEELKALEKFDAILTVSETDKQKFQEFNINKPIKSIPIAIDVTKSLSTKDINIDYPSVFFIGALDWFPNEEGLKWFLLNVWPRLSKMYPELSFYIAGRGDASWLRIENNTNVEFLGEIKDAAAFIKSKAIMIVPLFSGSGMRVKIIEGMSLGKAIVSTSVGVEGIIHKDGDNIMIADNPEAFIAYLSTLINDKSKFISICDNAIKNVERNYSNKLLTDKLIHFLNALQ